MALLCMRRTAMLPAADNARRHSVLGGSGISMTGRGPMTERTPKKIVIWGTGFVGRMVIAEIVDHPEFELVGVGVSNPDKVGRDVGEICGLASTLDSPTTCSP